MEHTDVVAVRDLRRRYGTGGGFEAVRGVSFAVARADAEILAATALPAAAIALAQAPVDVAGTFRAAAAPAGLLVAWLALGGAAVKRWFRWEPRR